jgi:hypothetical protein
VIKIGFPPNRVNPALLHMGSKALRSLTAITGLLQGSLAVAPLGNNLLEVAYHGDKPLIGDLRYLCGRGRNRMSDKRVGQAKSFDVVTQGTRRYPKPAGYLG